MKFRICVGFNVWRSWRTIVRARGGGKCSHKCQFPSIDDACQYGPSLLCVIGRNQTFLGPDFLARGFPGQVALGRYRPRAPTDPYVPALEHTVPQIMDSLRA